MRKKTPDKITDFYKKFNETKRAAENTTPGFHFFVDSPLSLKARPVLRPVLFICLTLIIFFGLAAGYQKIYARTFFPGLVLAGNDLGGKTYDEAQNLLTKKIDAFSRQGIPVKYNEKTVVVAAAPIADNPDTAFDLFRFDAEMSLRELWRRGRGGSPWRNLKEQIHGAIMRPDYALRYYLNEQKLTQLLQKNFNVFENPAQNATISIDNNSLTVLAEKHGKIFDYQTMVQAVRARLAHLDASDVVISLKTDYPTAYANDIEPLLAQAETILNKTPFKLVVPKDSLQNAGENVALDKNELAALLTAAPVSGSAAAFTVGLKPLETEDYLKKTVAPLVDIEPIDAKFAVQNGKVAEFVASADGQKLDATQSRRQLETRIQELLSETATTTEVLMVVAAAASEIKNDAVNSLGIVEIIASGQSNFAGSPPNRRHNIRVGAAAVNGTLIAPGEEFSLLKTLGDINSATGYLPELVIKGNQTVPEYGGGLCQIGTTVFRGATESGLPITARQNHSYRVSYYEPAGTDATIYSPAPDFKFINDTQYHILIQSRIEEDDLYFDFWGTSDGRAVTKTDPVIYNIAAPPPTKIIETDTLEPGVKKCTERAHNGADAYFDYTVAYADGNVKTERFKSHYRPWQEVCLVGVEKIATATPETTTE